MVNYKISFTTASAITLFYWGAGPISNATQEVYPTAVSGQITRISSLCFNTALFGTLNVNMSAVCSSAQTVPINGAYISYTRIV